HLLDVLDDRAGIDADRSILPRRLDDERKKNVVGMFKASAIGSRKEWSLDAVKREDLFGNRFVLGKNNGMGTGTRVAQSQQIDIGDHVHLLGVIAVERFGQVEKEVGIAPRERVQRLRTSIQLEIRRLVPQLLYRFEDFL